DSSGHLLTLHSFPTRRSSDLCPIADGTAHVYDVHSGQKVRLLGGGFDAALTHTLHHISPLQHRRERLPHIRRRVLPTIRNRGDIRLSRHQSPTTDAVILAEVKSSRPRPEERRVVQEEQSGRDSPE